MTARELVVLVTELPDESQFKRARSTAWTLSEQLLAAAVNIGHGQREDYRNAHGADYDYAPIEQPELEHERIAREAREAAEAHRKYLGSTVVDRMLRGQLRLADIDVRKSVEEVLAA